MSATETAPATATTTETSVPKARKASPKPKAKKEPIKLRAAQLRMLKELKRRNRSMTRQELVHAATGSPKGTLDGSYIGNLDPKARKVSEKKAGKPSLLTLGFIRMDEVQVEEGLAPERRYELTAAGKKYLASL